MGSTKYKRRKEEKRIRSLARIVLATCVSVACMMLGGLSIKLFAGGLFFKGVEEVSKEVQKVDVNIPALTEKIQNSLFDASFSVFKESIQEEENSLMAPYTTLMSLGLLQNSMAGTTLEEAQSFIGGYSISELNGAYAALMQKLNGYTNLRIQPHNSIWLKRYEPYLPKEYFLKVNATYYDADIYEADFTKDYTLNKVNEWFKTASEGKGVKKIQELGDETTLYLLSHLNFKADWLVPYESKDILGGEFKSINGEKKSVKYMYSKENYLEGDSIEGFIKPYTDNHCSFVAIRPTDGKTIYELIKGLDSTSFKHIIHSRSTQKAIVAIPKFTYESEINLGQSLQKLGVRSAFNKEEADFSKMYEETKEELYLEKVMQKNYIEVDEIGINGGVGSKGKKASDIEEDISKAMIFDTPFLYAIIDHETKLPLLIGIMADPIQ